MCRMKRLRLTRYIYKELCCALMDKPWKGKYAFKSAYRDIERARNGYGPKPYETDKFIMTKKSLGIKRLKELMGWRSPAGDSNIAGSWRRTSLGFEGRMPNGVMKK